MKHNLVNKRTKSIKISIIALLYVLLSASTSKALSVKDSVIFGRNIFLITWTDNDGKPRKAGIVKDDDQTYVGVCQYLSYYDGNTLVNITSPTPYDAMPHNTGFGATVHHDKNNPSSSASHSNGGTLSIVFQGAHHIVLNRVQTISGAIETVTYTFMDGHDYFQWQNTVDGTNGTLLGDSRGPYCTMMWDGIDFSASSGNEYGAEKYFSQPTYNGAWTFGGTCDIPYVLEWDNSREVGYVQTQTFTQQLAGNPTWDASLNLGSSGTTVDPNNDAWKFDFQMNFYDQAKKITWGMPFGYMKGDASAGTKNGWGQYSVSVVFDNQTENGVKRVRDENRAIQSGNVSLIANAGSVVTTGPVGTVNLATQTLSPAGYDHNYRTWWLSANASGQLDLSINISGGSILQNPSFRIKGMTSVPSSVVYNGTALVDGTDYYASYSSSLNEVWLTLKKNVSGNTTLQVGAVSTGIVINSFTANPATVLNDGSSSIDVSVDAVDDGSVASVKLDLSSVGGGASVTMTPAGGSNYTLNYTVPSSVSSGSKNITATVTDNSGNQSTKTIAVTVNALVNYLNIYTDAESKVTGTWAQNGTIAEQTGAGAIEGNKDYNFSFTAVNWWAGFGLNFDNWEADSPLDISNYQKLEVSFKGPTTATDLNIFLTGPSNTASTNYHTTSSASYTTVQIPLSDFAFDLTQITGIKFEIGGTQSGSGTLRIDNIRLSTSSFPEINLKVGGSDVASGGSYDFGTVTEMTTGSNIVFTVENLGTSALNLTGSPKVSISGTDASMFIIDETSLSSSVASSSSSTFTIAFSPASAGAKSAAITITNNDSDEGSYIIHLTGTGSVASTPEINVKVAGNSVASSGSYDFGSVTEMTTGSNIVFTVENLGSSTLNLTGTPKVVISGTDASMFTIDETSLSSSIASSSSSTFAIAFSPTSSGVKSATITITSNDSDEGSYTIHLTGTGSVATSVVDITAQGQFRISPNPFVDRITVEMSGVSGSVKLKVLDSYGVTVWESKDKIISGGDAFTVVLDGIPHGIYYVEIITSQRTITRKVIKQ